MSTITEELYFLPTDLQRLYQEITKDLMNFLGKTKDGLQSARRALIWVTVVTAVRPFHLYELLDAVATRPTNDSTRHPGDRWRFKVHSWVSFERQLTQLCDPFIEVIRPSIHAQNEVPRDWEIKEHDEVQLLHLTGKHFLQDRESAGPFYVSHDEAARIVE